MIFLENPQYGLLVKKASKENLTLVVPGEREKLLFQSIASKMRLKLITPLTVKEVKLVSGRNLLIVDTRMTMQIAFGKNRIAYAALPPISSWRAIINNFLDRFRRYD